MTLPWWRRLVSLFGAALAVAFAWAVPLGEAPDELAHIRYAEALANGRLPPLNGDLGEGYEAHQPLLGYLLPAAIIALRGGLELAPERSAAFDFNLSGSRAFRAPFAGDRDALTLRLARSGQAVWIGLGLWIALSLVPDPRSAAPFLLAPQLLFLGGAISNDAPLFALASAALAALLRFSRTGDAALLAASSVTLALFTKSSALFLLAPVVVAIRAARTSIEDKSDKDRASWTLIGATVAGVLLWLGAQFLRTGELLPQIPTSYRLATFGELLLDPSWLGGLFVSFWAKFGWLNTPLPAPVYLWFGALSLVALFGLIRLRGADGSLARAAVASNLALLVAFQLLVDRQAQGRYLFPSLAAIAAAGGALLPERLRPVAMAVAAVLALLSLMVVSITYA